MRQKLTIFLLFIVLILILVGLNAASYVQKEKTPDTEVSPNRSTFNSGTTGTLAFYSLLSETGRKVIRWQEPVDGLLDYGRNSVQTFVVTGTVRREFTAGEISKLRDWVSNGGTLVLIDREPPAGFVSGITTWNISLEQPNDPVLYSVDPANQKEMTGDTSAAKPVQPTLLTKGVNAVQPSRFASSVNFVRQSSGDWNKGQGNGSGIAGDEETYDFYQAPPPPPKAITNTNRSSDPHLNRSKTTENSDLVKLPSGAPVAHIGNGDQNLLVDVPFGDGRIIFLSDPFIVSNTGLNLIDNAQIGINIVTSGGGLIAFDEYHQGYGSNNNQLVQFFEGTPVSSIFLQLTAIAAFVFFSQSRRFARPLNEKEPDRLSKLEYVAAMAELQRRTKSYDLAIESIYNSFRRRSAKLLGVDNTTVKRKNLAILIAGRIKAEPMEIDETMFKCEDIIHGEPANQKETLRLVTRLREIEELLGLKRSRTAKI
ncbi:MAG: DUF4350 domain-containing protein [Pyrinomonadaceae bacterium]